METFWVGELPIGTSPNSTDVVLRLYIGPTTVTDPLVASEVSCAPLASERTISDIVKL